jgi:translation initiation factor 2 subunit 2
MSAEPLFDPSLKKRSKKKQVAFTEDPLGADADPTVPAPSLDNTTANGDVVDLGPKTVHEQMKQNEVGVDDVAPDSKEVKEEEDFKAMFGDLKKKKKKKEFPLDLVSQLNRRPSSWSRDDRPLP